MCFCKKDAQGYVDLLRISAAYYCAAVANLRNAMVQSDHKWHSANWSAQHRVMVLGRRLRAYCRYLHFKEIACLERQKLLLIALIL